MLPLTVFQSLPVKGILVVASPQELVSMIVEKAVKMAELMNIPVLGLVENMSYVECPDCGSRHRIFGESHIEETAEKFHISNVAKIPVDPKLTAGVDAGLIELFEGSWLDELADAVEKATERGKYICRYAKRCTGIFSFVMRWEGPVLFWKGCYFTEQEHRRVAI